MEDLTRVQKRVYYIIKDFIDKNGFSPTIREIGELNGNDSPATPLFHIRALKEKGYIDYKEGKGRTIRVIKWVKYIIVIKMKKERLIRT